MTVSFAPTDDGDVKGLVRDALTGYSDSVDEVPSDVLDTQLRMAKLELYNYTGSDAFYSDAGLGQALVGATAVYSKLSLENYSVDSWRVGDTEIDTGSFNNPREAQYEQYVSLVQQGLAASDVTSGRAPSNTSGYIDGW